MKKVEVLKEQIPIIKEKDLKNFYNKGWIDSSKFLPNGMNFYWGIVKIISDGKGLSPKKGTIYYNIQKVYRNDLAQKWQYANNSTEWIDVIYWMPIAELPDEIKIKK